MKDKIIKNTLYSGLSSVVVGLTGLFLLPFMIIKVGVVEYGLVGISSIFAMSGFISLLEMGFQSSISKYVAEYYARKDEQRICQIINTAIALFLAVGLLLMLLGLITSQYIIHLLQIPESYNSSFHLVMTIIFISYAFQFPTIVYAGLFQGLQRFDILKGVQTITTLITALSIIILLSYGYNYVAIVGCTIAALLIQLALYIYFSYALLPSLSITHRYLSYSVIVEIWTMTKFLFASKISSLIYYQTPKILISLFLGPVAMTSYEVIMRLPRFIKTMLGFLGSAVLPAASELHVTSQMEKLRKLFIYGLHYQIFFSYPVVLGAIYFADQFLLAWVGPDFIHLSGLLRFVLIWNLITPIIAYGGSLFVGMNNKLKRLTIMSILTTTVSLVLSLVLIWKYSLFGVIVGYVCGPLILFPFYLAMYCREFDIKLRFAVKELLKYFVMALIPSGAIMVLHQLIVHESLLTLLLNATVWCAIYWITLYHLVLENDEKNIITKYIPLLSK